MNGFFREYVWKRWDRSGYWPATRKAYLADHGECAACEAVKDLHVHHVQPVHNFPELELARANLITLCGRCHFTVGHCCNWKNWNIAVQSICKALRIGRRR